MCFVCKQDSVALRKTDFSKMNETNFPKEQLVWHTCFFPQKAMLRSSQSSSQANGNISLALWRDR